MGNFLERFVQNDIFLNKIWVEFFFKLLKLLQFREGLIFFNDNDEQQVNKILV